MIKGPTEILSDIAVSYLKEKLMKVSNCCGAPFYEPGWPDNDICSACKEHADAVDDEEVELLINGYDGDNRNELIEKNFNTEKKEADQRATNKVSIETAKEIVHRINGRSK